MLKPIDVEKKEFSKAVAGYSTREVQEFLEEVAKSMEAMIEQNMRLQADIRSYDDELRKFKDMEDTLKGALVLAQESSEDAIKNAREKARLLVENAEHEARKIMDGANDQLYKLQVKHDALKEDHERFKGRFKAMLENELSNLDR